MRIAIDTRWIRTQEMDGIGRYVLNLVTHLVQLDSNNEYFLITNPTLKSDAETRIQGDPEIFHLSLRPCVPASRRLHFVAAPCHLLSPQDFCFLPTFLNRLGIDLFHAPNYLTSPLTGRYARVITVHDLIPFLYPETLWGASLRWKLYYKSRYPTYLLLHKTDHIIADSACTKKDIMNLFGVSSEKITVIWPGVETRFCSEEKPSEAFLQKYHLKGDFVLYLGRQDPYKGLELLIQAYHRLDSSLRKQYRLAIAGKKDPKYLRPIEHLIDRLSLREQVQFLGYVPDADLPLLYKAATLFIYPSLYEGFGFPPVEAMASGTPVIYSRGSSLEEVIAANGRSFTPNCIPDLVQAIQTLLHDHRLRTEVSERGRRHTATFNWQKTVKAVLEVYIAAAGRRQKTKDNLGSRM